MNQVQLVAEAPVVDGGANPGDDPSNQTGIEIRFNFDFLAGQCR
ncbi:uncharacterized protein METZ01_LOCUS291436 [marine metagenome]|uniref:Uncharacterized protein n=1 Tax=marine metagenome TaxID=408172 RepID=A0A382LU68_9ZZZZ